MANPLTLNLIGLPDGQHEPDEDPNLDNRLPLGAWQAGLKAYCHGNWWTVQNDTDAERWQHFVDTVEQERIDRGGDPFSTGPGSEQSAIDAYENKLNNRLAQSLELALQWADEVYANLLLGEKGYIDADTVEAWTLGP